MFDVKRTSRFVCVSCLSDCHASALCPNYILTFIIWTTSWMSRITLHNHKAQQTSTNPQDSDERKPNPPKEIRPDRREEASHRRQQGKHMSSPLKNNEQFVKKWNILRMVSICKHLNQTCMSVSEQDSGINWNSLEWGHNTDSCDILRCETSILRYQRFDLPGLNCVSTNSTMLRPPASRSISRHRKTPSSHCSCEVIVQVPTASNNWEKVKQKPLT